MRKIESRKIWLGNVLDLWEVQKLLNTGIHAIVELADNELFAQLPREFIRCRIPLSDDGNNPPWQLRFAIKSVAFIFSAKVPVLVACSAGLSRSLCIAAGGLAIAEKIAFRDAMEIVVEKGPADVSPALIDAVQKIFSS